jgi:membrane protease YdiL (CAAX protease family)
MELILVALTAAGHIALEVAADGLQGAAGSLGRPQHIYNLAAAAAWSFYLIWRLGMSPEVRTEWGFRKGGFLASLRTSLALAAAAAIPLAVYGSWQHRMPLPLTFWLVVVLYPLWGLAQQFVLQGLVTKNLRAWIPSLTFRVLAAATLFSAAHFPDTRLMGLTFIAGLGFTCVFERYRNLWSIGLVHGILGAFAYYVVLGQDPGGELLKMLASMK